MSKKKNISKIRQIINKYGSFSVADIEAESSPIVSSTGDQVALAEKFGENVTVSVYVNDVEIDEYDTEYENLKGDVIADILSIAEEYEVDCDKAWKRAQD